jgi:iron complex outermembrane receptor protein
MFGGSVQLRRSLMFSTCALAVGIFASSMAHAGDTEAAATAAAAAAPAGPGLEEVIVTAERRGVNVQREPDAVTAVSGQTLDQSFSNKITDLNAIVPSLEVTKASGFENLVTIRGVGSETPENSLTTSPGVSEFIDGVYIANTISLDQTLFDVQDVEVLRGPQGALYGQSSIGGAIIINSTQPKIGKFDASADASFGTYDLFRERAEVNIPLDDHFALRLSGQKFDHDGYTKDLAIPGFDLDDAHDGSVKAALLFKPNDIFSATFTADLYQSDQHGDAQKNINDPASNPRELNQDYPAHFKLQAQLYHLNLQWNTPYFQVRSVTAYQGLDHIQQEDSSRSTFALLGDYDDVAAWNTHVHNYTEEFDLLSLPGSKLEWIVGAFGLYQGSKQFVVEYGGSTAPSPAALAIPNDVTTSPPSNLNYGNLSHVTRRSFSEFAQVTYHLTEALRVTAGVRENADFFKDDSYNFSANGISTVDHESKTTLPTWRAEADYDLTKANLIYASVARGYKPGGVNGSYGQQLIPANFQPETNYAYEVGSKNTFFGNALRLNAAAFYYIHRNFQYIETDPVPFDGGIANIPHIDDYGLELEGQYVALENRFRLGGSLALENGEVIGKTPALDSTVANSIENSYSGGCFAGPYGYYFIFPNYNSCTAAVLGARTNIQGKTPPAMPKTSGSLYTSYLWDAPGGTLLSRVEIVYRGSEWARIFDVPSLDRIPSYVVTDLYFEYRPLRSAWKVSLAATNLFDKAGINSRYTDPYGTGQTSQQFIPPRQVIGSIAYSF